MKNMMIVSAFLLTGAFANASFNTDAHEGAVKCTAGNFNVSINAKRNVLKDWSSFDPGHPETFDVVRGDSDGDTFVEYETKDKSVVLSFDDRGDQITFRDTKETIKLKCPDQ